MDNVYFAKDGASGSQAFGILHRYRKVAWMEGEFFG